MISAVRKKKRDGEGLGSQVSAYLTEVSSAEGRCRDFKHCAMAVKSVT
jgi:hypothetical protein